MALAAERGWAVRWVSGTLAAQSIPLGACARWADRLDGDPLQLVSNVIAKVTASPNGAPVLVVVDDSLLDDLSAFVLHQLVLRRTATVIATICTGAPAPDAVTALWKDGHLQRLDLQPLSRRESDILLQSALGGPVSTACAERMWRLTRGNVLFLHQLVNQEIQAGRLLSRDGQWRWVGTMEVSPSLIDLVDLRIGSTPEPVLEVIDLVAIARRTTRADAPGHTGRCGRDRGRRASRPDHRVTHDPDNCGAPGPSPLRRSPAGAGGAPATQTLTGTHRPRYVRLQ